MLVSLWLKETEVTDEELVISLRDGHLLDFGGIQGTREAQI